MTEGEPRARRRRNHPAGPTRAVVGGVAVSATLLGVAGLSLANPAVPEQVDAEAPLDVVAEAGPAGTWPTPAAGLGAATPPSTAAAAPATAPTTAAPTTTPATAAPRATVATAPATTARTTATTRRATPTTTARTAPPRTRTS